MPLSLARKKTLICHFEYAEIPWNHHFAPMWKLNHLCINLFPNTSPTLMRTNVYKAILTAFCTFLSTGSRSRGVKARKSKGNLQTPGRETRPELAGGDACATGLDSRPALSDNPTT